MLFGLLIEPRKLNGLLRRTNLLDYSWELVNGPAWIGKVGVAYRGLVCCLFIVYLLFQIYKGPAPHVLGVHLGGNDLGLLKGKALVLQARKDFQVICRRWPSMIIIWSAMVPSKAWRNTISPGVVEKVKKKVNRKFQVFLEYSLGHYLPHLLPSALDDSLYRPDGVHLLAKGLDIFLSNLQQGIFEAIGLGGGGPRA